MKYIFFFLVSTSIFFSCKPKDKKTDENSSSTSTEKVVISGYIDGMDTGLVLIHKDDYVNETTPASKPDSIFVKGGKFKYTAQVSEPTQFMMALAGAEDLPPLVFYADPGTVSIKARVDSLAIADVTGGKTQTDYNEAANGLKPIFSKATPYYHQMQEAQQKNDVATQSKIQNIFNGIQLEVIDYITKFVAAHPASVVSPQLIYTYMNDKAHTNEMKMAFDKLSPTTQNSLPGMRLKNYLDKVANTAVGGTATDFSLADKDGKMVSLSSFKGKYLLVDFWASWCGPCRQENPNVVAAYETFKNKGFDILGVSLDEDKAAWQAAIAKDHLNWTQISDLKGWQNEAAKKYNVESIPMNFLLDKEGKIIATSLRGPELQAKLKELMP